MHEVYRNISLVFEVRTAIKFLRNGLAEIQKITAKNDFYHPPLLYLSNGLERLLKVMLCLNFKERKGRLPNYKELIVGQNGHDIEVLKDRVVKICRPIDHPPFATRDYMVITNSKLANRVCTILSEYGKRARYFNLDAVLGTNQEFDPQQEWEKLETEVLKEKLGSSKYYEILSKPSMLESLYQQSNQIIVFELERFFRAITRQFIFGDFSSESKQFWVEIQDFSDIDDDSLGKIDYRKLSNEEWIKR